MSVNVEKELLKDLNNIVNEEIKKTQNKMSVVTPIFNLPTYDSKRMVFEIGEAGEILDKGIPFKDRYPLSFRRVKEWAILLNINGGAAWGKLFYKGSTKSKNWINRFIMEMEAN